MNSLKYFKHLFFFSLFKLLNSSAIDDFFFFWNQLIKSDVESFFCWTSKIFFRFSKCNLRIVAGMISRNRLLINISNFIKPTHEKKISIPKMSALMTFNPIDWKNYSAQLILMDHQLNASRAQLRTSIDRLNSAGNQKQLSVNV